jgi:hypothetical protein
LSRPFHKPVCAARREIEIHRPRRQGVSGYGGGLRDKKSTHVETRVYAGSTHVAEWCEAVQLTHPWVVKVKVKKMCGLNTGISKWFMW